VENNIMTHFIVEHYLSFSDKWSEMKTCSTRQEAIEFLENLIDDIAQTLDESDDGDFSVDFLMNSIYKDYRVVEMGVA
jgi:hypothetical protein